MRVGLTPTLRSSSPRSAPRQPATRKKAAEEKSAGHRDVRAARAAGRPRGDRRAVPQRPRRRTRCSMRSVWSRDGAGSVTRVRPRPEAASSTRRFHLGAGHRQGVVDGAQLPACRWISTGGRPSCVRMSAPIVAQRHRHALHRPAHQRLIADQRGVERLRREQPHEEPHRRAGVAHVERRGGGREARRAPRRCTRTLLGSGRSMRTPSACSARSVARQSSPARKPVISVSPSAMPPSISARWEIDLSPGTVSSPAMLPAGLDAIASPCRSRHAHLQHRARIGAEHPEQRGALLQRRERLGHVRRPRRVPRCR